MIPVIAFCGPSNSGKTSFLCTLIEHLGHHQMRVGALKHCHCRLTEDDTGKDSSKLRQAGADPVFAVDNLNQARTLLQTAFQNHDLVIAEGFRRLQLPSILLYRQSIPADWLSPTNLIGQIYLPPLQRPQPIKAAIQIIRQQYPKLKLPALDKL